MSPYGALKWQDAKTTLWLMVVHDTSNLNPSNKHKHNMTKMIDLIVKY